MYLINFVYFTHPPPNRSLESTPEIKFSCLTVNNIFKKKQSVFRPGYFFKSISRYLLFLGNLPASTSTNR